MFFEIPQDLLVVSAQGAAFLFPDAAAVEELFENLVRSEAREIVLSSPQILRKI